MPRWNVDLSAGRGVPRARRAAEAWSAARESQGGHASSRIPGVEGLLRRKYGLLKRAVDLLNRRAAPDAWVAVEIVDEGE